MGIFSTLPPYTGPYKGNVFNFGAVFGTTDVELPVANPRAFGTALLKDGSPALYLDQILFTIYYPASPLATSRPRQMPWLERPLSVSVGGYSKFAGKPRWLLTPVFYLLAGRAKLPATIDAPLRLAKSAETSEASTLVGESSEKGREDLAVQKDDKFPLVVFSHGLGGNRTTYSQYCGELASRGYIVVALESRDGTAPATALYGDDGKIRKVVQYYKDGDLHFAPPNPKLSSIDFRKEELVMRLAEVEEALKVVTRINDGEGFKIAKENRRRSSAGTNYDFKNWAGRIDLTKDVTMAGHSFGGATTLQVLRAGPKFPFVRGICLDPWVDPVPPFDPTASSPEPAADSPETLANDISVPLLVINSESFTLWTPHYKTLLEIVKGVKEDAEAWFMTLVGSVHMSFSDLPLLQPYIGRKTGARVDPALAMSLFGEASMEFLGGNGKMGTILGQEVLPGDEKGARPGEGSKQDGGQPMKEVGQMRMHVRPT